MTPKSGPRAAIPVALNSQNVSILAYQSGSERLFKMLLEKIYFLRDRRDPVVDILCRHVPKPFKTTLDGSQLQIRRETEPERCALTCFRPLRQLARTARPSDMTWKQIICHESRILRKCWNLKINILLKLFLSKKFLSVWATTLHEPRAHYRLQECAKPEAYLAIHGHQV